MQQTKPWRSDDASATSKALGEGVNGGATSNGKSRWLADYRGRRQARHKKKAKAAMRCLALTRAVRESPKYSRCGQYEADPAMLAISIAGT